MSAAYWRQWDDDDLKFYRGINDAGADITKESYDIERSNKDQEDAFTGSMEDYGLSWRDFI